METLPESQDFGFGVMNGLVLPPWAAEFFYTGLAYRY